MRFGILKVSKVNDKLIGTVISPEEYSDEREVAFLIQKTFTKSKICEGLVYNKESFLPENNSNLFVGTDGENEYFIYDLDGKEVYVMYIDMNKEVEKVEIT